MHSPDESNLNENEGWIKVNQKNRSSKNSKNHSKNSTIVEQNEFKKSKFMETESSSTNKKKLRSRKNSRKNQLLSNGKNHIVEDRKAAESENVSFVNNTVWKTDNILICKEKENTSTSSNGVWRRWDKIATTNCETFNDSKDQLAKKSNFSDKENSQGTIEKTLDTSNGNIDETMDKNVSMLSKPSTDPCETYSPKNLTPETDKDLLAELAQQREEIRMNREKFEQLEKKFNDVTNVLNYCTKVINILWLAIDASNRKSDDTKNKLNEVNNAGSVSHSNSNEETVNDNDSNANVRTDKDVKHQNFSAQWINQQQVNPYTQYPMVPRAMQIPQRIPYSVNVMQTGIPPVNMCYSQPVMDTYSNQFGNIPRSFVSPPYSMFPDISLKNVIYGTQNSDHGARRKYRNFHRDSSQKNNEVPTMISKESDSNVSDGQQNENMTKDEVEMKNGLVHSEDEKKPVVDEKVINSNN